jgi:hypothetical protein
MIASVQLSSQDKISANGLDGDLSKTSNTPAETGNNNEVMLRCPNQDCGHMNPPDAKRCQLCNELLVEPPNKPTSKNKAATAVDPKVTPPPIVSAGSTHQQSVRPYRTGGQDFYSLRDIAHYFVKHWDIGMQQIDDNYLLKWAEANFETGLDIDAVEFIKALIRNQNRPDDIRLMQFIARFADTLPPIWKDVVLTKENIITLLVQAYSEDHATQELCFELFQRKIIDMLLVVRRDADLEWCLQAIENTQNSYSLALRKLSETKGPIHLLSDSDTNIGMTLMLVALSDTHRQKIRDEVKSIAGKAGKYCPWFAALGGINQANSGMLVVMLKVAPVAAQIAADARKVAQQKFLKVAGITTAVLLLLSAGYYGYRQYSSKLFTLKTKMLAKTAKKTVVVIAPNVNIRNKPDKTAKTVARASKGLELTFIGEQGNWFKVELQNGKVGWVHKSLVNTNSNN